MRECPKLMLNGPCGGYRGVRCELEELECPWVKAYLKLREMGRQWELARPNLAGLPKAKICRAKEFPKMLEAGVLIAEFYPSTKKPLSELIKRAKKLLELADAVQIVDSPLGLPSADPVPLATLLALEGYTVIPEIMCRGRSRSLLSRTIATLASSGIQAMFVATGDYPIDREEKPLFDLDSTRLVYLAKLVTCHGIDHLGRRFAMPRELAIGVGVDPNSTFPELEAIRLSRKLSAGADFVVTQLVTDPERVLCLWDILREKGLRPQIVVSYPVVTDLEASKLLQKLTPGAKAYIPSQDVVSSFLDFRDELKAVTRSFYISALGSFKKLANFLEELKERE